MASNGGNMGSLGVTASHAKVEMDAFDQLPPEFRAIFRFSPVLMTVRGCGPAIARMGREQAKNALVNSLHNDIPRLTAAAWGNDHPSLKR